MNKETLIKLLTGVFAKWIRYAITTAFGAKMVNAVGTDSFNADNFAIGLAGIVSSLAWSHWEDYMKKKAAQEPKPGAEVKPIGINLQGVMLAGLIALSALTACTTLNGDRKLDVARVARLSGAAAELSATAYLLQHPQDRVHFEAVRVALSGLESTNNYDPAAFVKALQALPI